MKPKNYENLIKSVRFEIETKNKIEEMAKENDRTFSDQVRFMCKEYIKIVEKK